MDNRLYGASEIAAAGLKSDTELYLSVKRELEVHLQETVERVEDAGKSNNDAVDIALKKFGSPAETANTILQVNARRLKFRARLRLFIIALVPLIALAIVLFSIIPRWNLLRLKREQDVYYQFDAKSKKIYEKNVAKAAGVDLAKLTQQQQFILNCDWKSLSKMFPEDRAYFAYDFLNSINTYPNGQLNSSNNSIKAMTWLTKIIELDTDNALYSYITVAGILSYGSKYRRERIGKRYGKVLIFMIIARLWRRCLTIYKAYDSLFTAIIVRKFFGNE